MTMLDDDEPKKTPRATVIRRAILVVLALACTGWLLYTRVFVKKVGLGEPCGSNMHCRFEAPKCLKSSADSDGVCSRACVDDGECADGIKCVKVELEEYDERGRPIEGGYCFPQAILDARKKKKDAGSAAKKGDSWIDVPEAPALEAEIDLVHDPRPGSEKTPVKYLVKGSLLRMAPEPNETTRFIADVSSFRLFQVDDKQRSFGVHSLDAIRASTGTLTKTERKDRVAGRECEIWDVEGKGTRYELCVITGGSFVETKGRAAPPWVHELAVRNAFPLRVVSKPASGPEVVKLLATKVEPKVLEPALFEVPKSYTNKAR